MVAEIEESAAMDAPSPPVASRLERALTVRARSVLATIIVLFIVVHVGRIGRVLLNGDGNFYLSGAMRIANGDLPFSRYSPGFPLLLSPSAVVFDGSPRTLFFVVGFVNIAVSVAAIVMLRQFLRRYLSEAVTLALVAVFALGETATNVLVGTEVEPLALLLVVLTLVALQRERTWLAVTTTAVAGMCRIALVPFFGVLWVVRWRRSPRQSPVAVALLGLDAVTYLALSRQGGYVGIAGRVYSGAHDGGSGAAAGLLEIVPDHLVRYSRLGWPSVLWPSKVLSTPPGYVLGAATFLCMVVGAAVLLRRRSEVADDGVLRPALLGTAAYVLLLWFWPANDGAVLRLSTPLAPLALLAAVVGARHLAGLVSLRRPAEAIAAVAVLGVAFTVAVAASAGLVATKRHTDGRVADFVSATRRAADLAPPGPFLSLSPGIAQVASGRQVVAYDRDVTGEEARQLAERSGACTVVVSSVQGRPERLDAFLRQSDRASVLVAVGGTSVFTLIEPWCLDSG